LIDGKLMSRLPPTHPYITVENGHTIPVPYRGNSILPTSASHFTLNNFLVVASLVPNLLSIR
jgi:hypothetical protein